MQALIQKLEQFEKNNVVAYGFIQAELLILSKYVQLQQTRQDYMPPIGASLSMLDDIQRHDEALKQRIYQQDVEGAEVFFATLALEEMVPLLALETAQSVLNALQKHHQTLYQKLLAWEQNLALKIKAQKKSWSHYLPWLGKHIVAAFYQSSFMGLGAELMDWCSAALLARWQKGPQTNRLFLLKPIARIFGSGLGLALSYVKGAYTVLKFMATHLLGQYLIRHTCRVDDWRACVVSSVRFAPQSLINGVQLATAGIEGAYAGSYRQILVTLGGVMVQTGVTTMLQPTTPHRQFAQRNEAQLLHVWLIALTSFNVGYQFTELGLFVFEKLMDRLTLINTLGGLAVSQNMQGLAIDYSNNPVWWPQFWSSTDDSVKLSWTQQGKFYEAVCSVQRLPTAKNLICEQPNAMPHLPLKAL